MALLICVPGPVLAESCFAPSRPFLPSDSQAARDYADIIRGDFEDYIQDIQRYVIGGAILDHGSGGVVRSRAA